MGEQRGTHVGRAHEVPIVGVDYSYMTEKGFEHRSEMALGDAEVKTAREGGDIVLCLIIRCYATKNVFCHVVPCKGDDEDKFVVNLAVDDIGWLSHTRVILKSDQERSLVSLVTRALEVLKYRVDTLESVIFSPLAHSPPHNLPHHRHLNRGSNPLSGEPIGT